MAAEGLRVCFALLALYALNYCWRTYRIDVFRQYVFDLRDELFDMAAENHWFEKRPYLLLRAHLNASIRFAHKTSLLRILIFRVALPAERFDKSNPWARLIREAETPELRNRLEMLHQRFDLLVTDGVLSPIFPLFVLYKSSQWYHQFYGSLVNADRFEAHSYEVERLEHRRMNRMTA